MFADNSISTSMISPYHELISYELLWAEKKSSFKTMAEQLIKPPKLPSQIVDEKYTNLFSENPEHIDDIKKLISTKIGKFSIMMKENEQYPKQLLDAKYPVDLFYYKGNLDIAKENKLISVVGTRSLSQDGIWRTQKLVTLLAKDGYSIVSGLARGTDTVALTTAIKNNAKVIGVIGTPIDEYYPKENKPLQDIIAEKHLLISQVPFYKYSVEPFQTKKIYFVERDATMAALAKATVIVEAGETSGTLIQARACIQQGRKLFILKSCFDNPSITWPKKYEQEGAVKVENIEDILSILDENYK